MSNGSFIPRSQIPGYERTEKMVLRDSTGKVVGEREVQTTMSDHEVQQYRSREQQAAEKAAAIAQRQAAAIAAKTDKRTDLEKRRDGVRDYVSELRQSGASESRIAQFQSALSDLDEQVQAEARAKEWAESPDISRMLEHASTLRSIKVAYDALPQTEEVDAKIALAAAIAQSTEFRDTRTQHNEYFKLIDELSTLNLEGHKQRTAEAENKKQEADAYLAKQLAAQTNAERERQ